MPRHAVLVAAALALVTSCAAPPTNVVDAADGDPSQEIGIPPGQFAEADLDMSMGDTVTAVFETNGGALRWDVHSHAGDLVIHDEGVSASDTIAFTAPELGQFSLLWENQSESPIVMTVTIELTGTSEIVSWSLP